MDLSTSIALLAFGFVLLAKGADWFVDGASGIATKLKIPQIVIGLTIVAMGTSAPEAAVSISSALKGNADITIGNVVGSNILNVLIILGISSVIAILAVPKSTTWVDIPVTIGATVILLLMGLDGEISLVDGIIMIVCFIAYLTYLFIMTKKNPPAENETPSVDVNKKHFLLKSLAMTVVGLAAIVWGSDLSVDGATALAKAFGVSDRVIGLTIIALGTSLPELFTSVAAAMKKNSDIAVGNIVGSNIFNILIVVGVSAAITPVPFDKPFIIDAIVALLTMVLLMIFCLAFKKLNRFAGIVMLLCYVGYFVYLLLSGGAQPAEPEVGEQLSSAASSALTSALSSTALL
ncbi:MAG: calcium/sodium antiporter [Clostridia bacterium]|nr:calcium/sodium antiporter [Clostridia bacterium]